MTFSDRTQLSGSSDKGVRGDGRPYKRELLWLILPALNVQRKRQGQKKHNQHVSYKKHEHSIWKLVNVCKSFYSSSLLNLDDHS